MFVWGFLFWVLTWARASSLAWAWAFARASTMDCCCCCCCCCCCWGCWGWGWGFVGREGERGGVWGESLGEDWEGEFDREGEWGGISGSLKMRIRSCFWSFVSLSGKMMSN